MGALNLVYCFETSSWTSDYSYAENFAILTDPATVAFSGHTLMVGWTHGWGL